MPHQPQPSSAVEARLIALGREAAGVAHDFDNVLTAIAHFAALLRSRAVDPDTVAHAEAILRSVRVGTGIVGRVRGLFQGSSDPTRQRVDLTALLADVAAGAEGRAAARGVAITFDGVAHDFIVAGDPVELAQALTNLTHNAIDAARARVRLGLDASGLVTIADDGPGIPEATRARMFDTGFTTRADGTGLGLPAALRAIHAHHGHLDIVSGPHGTTASVRLPAAADAASLAPPRPLSDLDLTAGAAGATVLVVDDDPATASAMVAIIEAAGFKVVAAHDSGQALLQFHTLRPDCVVSDLMLGRVSAVAMLDRFGALDPSIPVIIATGHASDRLPPGLAERAAKVLLKPFSPNRLLDAVRQLVAERRGMKGPEGRP